MLCCSIWEFLCGPRAKRIFFDIDDTFFHFLSSGESKTLYDKGSINIGIFNVREEDIIKHNGSYFYLIGKDHYQAIFNELENEGFEIGFCTAGDWVNDFDSHNTSPSNIHELLKKYCLESSRVFNFDELKKYYNSNIGDDLSIKRCKFSKTGKKDQTVIEFQIYDRDNHYWLPIFGEEFLYEYSTLKHGFLESLDTSCLGSTYLLVDNDKNHCVRAKKPASAYDSSQGEYLKKAHHFRFSVRDFKNMWHDDMDTALKEHYVFLDLCLGIEEYFNMPLEYTEKLFKSIDDKTGENANINNFRDRLYKNHKSSKEDISVSRV